MPERTMAEMALVADRLSEASWVAAARAASRAAESVAKRAGDGHSYVSELWCRAANFYKAAEVLKERKLKPVSEGGENGEG